MVTNGSGYLLVVVDLLGEPSHEVGHATLPLSEMSAVVMPGRLIT